MKKIIKLTESELESIIERVLQEQGSMFGTAGNNIPGYRQDDLRNKPSSKKVVTPRVYDINPKKLKMGDGGSRNPKQVEDVKKLQSELVRLGFLVLTQGPTGYFGKLTQKALDKYYSSKDKTDLSQTKKDVIKSNEPGTMSKNINPEFMKKFNFEKLSTKDSTPVCKAGQENCAQFVNDFSDKIKWVGNAWIAHDNNSLGEKVWSSYNSLKPDVIKKVTDLYKKIDSKGGGEENGRYIGDVKELQGLLVPKTTPVKLELDDVVGIYYPPSKHHEEAFYQAGEGYFTKDKSGQIQPKSNLASGKGFGMNTHVGIVGAVKDGVPLIFHNILGQVYSDPADKLKDNGRIAWVRRGKSWFDRFKGLDT